MNTEHQVKTVDTALCGSNGNISPEKDRKRTLRSSRQQPDSADEEPCSGSKKLKTGKNDMHKSKNANFETELGSTRMEASMFVEENQELMDAMMILLDQRLNLEMFFTIRLVACEGRLRGQVVFTVQTRCGETGTQGALRRYEFSDIQSAKQCFKEKFRLKTGYDWEKRNGTPIEGKYKFIRRTSPVVTADHTAICQ